MNQARVVDINRYYRLGGVDWDKVALNFDAVGICAGVGIEMDYLLSEHVAGCKAIHMPYFTYHIPDRAYSMARNADFYAVMPGVKEAIMVADIESPKNGSKCVTSGEAQAYVNHLATLTLRHPWHYTNPATLDTLSWPAWIGSAPIWIAQYPWQPYTVLKYTGYETFLKRWAGLAPTRLAKSIYKNAVVLWQFTDKGEAPKLCAKKPADPRFPKAIQGADLNVSTIERDIFLDMLRINYA